MRKMKLAMLIVFCVMLFGGTVVSFVLPDREFSDVENRELAKKPKITAKRILSGEYQKEYDTYLSDQFFFRDKWVDLAVREQIALGKKDFNGVYLGKNNYLLEKYEKADFDSGQIKENETYLTTFLNETEKRYGRKHVRAMFVPSKTTALTNVLPAYADTIDWQSKIRDLQTKVDEPNLIYDLTKTMQSHNEEYIYYRTDHHWTTLGAYYAYTEFCKAKGITPESLDAYSKKQDFDGFLGSFYNDTSDAKLKANPDTVTAYYPNAESICHVTASDGKKYDWPVIYDVSNYNAGLKYSTFIASDNPYTEIENKDLSDGSSCIVVKESFGNAFIPFLVDHYQTVYVVDYRYWTGSISKLAQDKNVNDVLFLNNLSMIRNKSLVGKLYRVL